MNIFSRFRKNKLETVDLDTIEPFSFGSELRKARITRVIDGDSVNVAIKFNKKIAGLKCRLYGIDTPETRCKDPVEKAAGLYVKKYLANLFDEAAGIVWIQCYHFDNFGRVLIKIYTNPNGPISVNEQLVNMNYAYAYDGKKKRKFSEWNTSLNSITL